MSSPALSLNLKGTNVSKYKTLGSDPVTHRPDSQINDGLTKREHFASLAMQGMCAHPEFEINDPHIADIALQHADALIEALNK